MGCLFGCVWWLCVCFGLGAVLGVFVGLLVLLVYYFCLVFRVFGLFGWFCDVGVFTTMHVLFVYYYECWLWVRFVLVGWLFGGCLVYVLGYVWLFWLLLGLGFV